MPRYIATVADHPSEPPDISYYEAADATTVYKHILKNLRVRWDIFDDIDWTDCDYEESIDIVSNYKFIVANRYITNWSTFIVYLFTQSPEYVEDITDKICQEFWLVLNVREYREPEFTKLT